jgi:hypothetical protein
LALGIAVLATSWRALEGETNLPVAQSSVPAAAADPLIVHEWGTFTSFSGSDGVQLDFRPNVDHELPAFVETRLSHMGDLFIKREIRAPLRMETPVTYFYTNRPRDVDVRVQFSQGLLTEFYPPPKQIGPLVGTEGPELMKNSFLDWGRVHLIPPKQFAKTRVIYADDKKELASLPKVGGDDHYGFARETDSAIVAAKSQFGELHFEKFLFYRGVGKFKLPIALEAHGGGRFTVTNFGGDPAGAMFLVHIENGRVRFGQAGPLAARGALHFEEPQADSTIDTLAGEMGRSLVEAGLYEKEARAMVNTWRSSWFGEEGTRLLYLVPQRLTDGLLPLSIKPAPDKLVRVLVGRLEIVTPERDRQIHDAVEGMGTCLDVAVEPIRSQIQSLGRFAEPTLERMAEQSANESFRAAANSLLSAIRDDEQLKPVDVLKQYKY